MKYDVLVIGAGPGGIFTAYELSHKAPSLKIAVLECGGELRERPAPSTATRSKAASTARPAPL